MQRAARSTVPILNPAHEKKVFRQYIRQYNKNPSTIRTPILPPSTVQYKNYYHLTHSFIVLSVQCVLGHYCSNINFR